jgi:hypothetical protein
VRERAIVREKRALIGYNADKVQAYISFLQSELLALEKQRREEHQSYMLQKAELLYEVYRLKDKEHELNNMEKSLKQWIQRNQ